MELLVEVWGDRESARKASSRSSPLSFLKWRHPVVGAACQLPTKCRLQWWAQANRSRSSRHLCPLLLALKSPLSRPPNKRRPTGFLVDFRYKFRTEYPRIKKLQIFFKNLIIMLSLMINYKNLDFSQILEKGINF